MRKKYFLRLNLKGGVAISFYDALSNFKPIKIYISNATLKSINDKVMKKGEKSFSSIVYPSESYRFTKQVHYDYPNIKSLLSKGHENDLKSSVFASLDNVIFFKDKPNNSDYVMIVGLFGGNRETRWIKRSYLKVAENFDYYKILLPKSNGSPSIDEGKITSIIGKPQIAEPYIGHTQTFISIGKFDDCEQVNAAFKYLQTKFARAMLGILKITQDNPPDKWKYVPMQDFTADSDIDWSKSVAEIDRQLYAKYGLDKEEIAFIETHVKEMK